MSAERPTILRLRRHCDLLNKVQVGAAKSSIHAQSATDYEHCQATGEEVYRGGPLPVSRPARSSHD